MPCGPNTGPQRLVRIGTVSDVAWINTGTSVGLTIASGIPPVFNDYATVVLPKNDAEQPQHDRAVMAVLKSLSPDQRWWLGYLERGGSDIVFPDAPPVRSTPIVQLPRGLLFSIDAIAVVDDSNPH